jgi:hypothetical protein
MTATEPFSPPGIAVGRRYRLPSGRVAQVKRVVQTHGQFVAVCGYVQGARRLDGLGDATLRTDWIQRYGRATA